MSDILYRIDFDGSSYKVEQHIDQLGPNNKDRVGFVITADLENYLNQEGLQAALQRDTPTRDPFDSKIFTADNQGNLIILKVTRVPNYFDVNIHGNRKDQQFHLNCGAVDSNNVFNKFPGVVSLPFPI
jgi:hypothetical protein